MSGMRTLLASALAVAALGAGVPAGADPAGGVPPAIYTDPITDSAHPARLAVLHIPSGGVRINGVAYVASGGGPHPTVILLHGLPGNEKNLDLAQAIRRDGWNVVTFNYRGSWGSPGVFRFGQNLEDADAVLAYVRDPADAQALGIDPRCVVMMGHSMGGWVTVTTAAHHPELAGLATISAGDMAGLGAAPQSVRVKEMADNMESLAGVTAESMAEDVTSVIRYPMTAAAAGLVKTPYLALTSNDGLAANTDSLVSAIRAKGGTLVTEQHMATDHSWSDHRVALEVAVLTWLEQLRASPACSGR
jgi:pimeloyl-ACP methyl ester carboxylesterase